MTPWRSLWAAPRRAAGQQQSRKRASMRQHYTRGIALRLSAKSATFRLHGQPCCVSHGLIRPAGCGYTTPQSPNRVRTHLCRHILTVFLSSRTFASGCPRNSGILIGVASTRDVRRSTERATNASCILVPPAMETGLLSLLRCPELTSQAFATQLITARTTCTG